MSQVKSVLDLCENLANVNLRICNQIKNGELNEEILSEYFENIAKEFKKYSKILKSNYGISNESNCSEDNDEWKEIEDETDELIDRLNRLKPVVPDFKESKFEEFDEPEFDEFYEPDIEDFEEPEFEDFEVPNEFEELNKDANELLINRKRMKKKEFTKKLDIYLIVMKKKLINNPKKYCELKKSIEAFKMKLQRRKKMSNDLIKIMLSFVRENSVN